jgi:hypothetical protein
VSCVYTVSPEELTFGQAGGKGTFKVTTLPGDCQWTIEDLYTGVEFTSPTRGTGAATVYPRRLFVECLTGVKRPAIHTENIVR